MKQTGIFILGLVVILSIVSCSQKHEKFQLPEKQLIIGVASPIKLDPGKTEVVLTDYFPTEPVIDSVTASEGIIVSAIHDQKVTLSPANADIPKIGALHVYTEG